MRSSHKLNLCRLEGGFCAVKCAQGTAALRTHGVGWRVTSRSWEAVTHAEKLWKETKGAKSQIAGVERTWD